MKRLLLGVGLAVALAASYAFAQVPPTGSGVVGWLQAVYNQLSDSAGSGPRTFITASATGTTAATTATLAAASGKTTFICGFNIASKATAAAAGNATVTGVVTATMTFQMATAATPAVATTQQTFTPCIPGSGTNQAIAVVSAAPGTGGVISVTAWGYQR